MPSVKSGQRVAYILYCRRHVAYLLPDSVRRRPNTALRCRACQHGGSKLWRHVLRVLQECVQGLGPIAFEVYVLPGLQKRFDIYLLDWGIAIEVDGNQPKKAAATAATRIISGFAAGMLEPAAGKSKTLSLPVRRWQHTRVRQAGVLPLMR